MTRDEAIKILNGYMCGKIEPESTELYHAIELVVDILESQSSLPSNLDEAAKKVEDYYDVGEEHGYLYCHRGDIKDAFKAGAEWMDGQGINIESNVVLTQEEDTCRPYLALQDFGYMPAPKFCKESDKVIIQIRKK